MPLLSTPDLYTECTIQRVVNNVRFLNRLACVTLFLLERQPSEHGPHQVPELKQCLSEPVALMPFVQQGIWVLHTASSISVFRLRSAWTTVCCLPVLMVQHSIAAAFALEPWQVGVQGVPEGASGLSANFRVTSIG